MNVAFYKSLNTFMAAADCGYWTPGPKHVLVVHWVALSSPWFTGD